MQWKRWSPCVPLLQVMANMNSLQLKKMLQRIRVYVKQLLQRSKSLIVSVAYVSSYTESAVLVNVSKPSGMFVTPKASKNNGSSISPSRVARGRVDTEAIRALQVLSRSNKIVEMKV